MKRPAIEGGAVQEADTTFLPDEYSVEVNAGFVPDERNYLGFEGKIKNRLIEETGRGIG